MIEASQRRFRNAEAVLEAVEKPCFCLTHLLLAIPQQLAALGSEFDGDWKSAFAGKPRSYR
jgi:hypothetical protein